MIHPNAESSGADSGFVVAADVISEKELKSCFVSQTLSLKWSSLKKKKSDFIRKRTFQTPNL